MTTSVSVLGSTGSIGTQTLEIIRERPGDYTVTALGVGRNLDVVAQAEEFPENLSQPLQIEETGYFLEFEDMDSKEKMEMVDYRGEKVV